MTAETLSERVEAFRITRPMVDDFRLSTQDGNDLHGGEPGIVLGFQTGGICRGFADAEMSSIAQNLICCSQEIYFKRAVRIGSKVNLKVKEIKPEGDKYKISVLLFKEGQTEPNAESNLIYGPELPKASKEQQGNEYLLRQEDAEGVARGLNMKSGMDLATLAFGLASNALYADGKDLVQRAAAQTPPKLPIYVRHTLHPYSALGKATSESLKVGDSIIISTNAEQVAQKMARRSVKTDPSRKRDDVYTTDVLATTKSGLIVYHAELMVLFKTREEVLKDA